MANFKKLKDEIFDFYCQEDPVRSTFLGVKGFDNLFLDFSLESLNLNQKKRKQFLLKLKNLSHTNFSHDQKIDWEYIVSTLEVESMMFDNFKLHLRHASIYLEKILYGLYILTLRNKKLNENVLNSINSRLTIIPKALEEAKKNLNINENIPKIWTEISLEKCDQGIIFLDNFVENFLKNTNSKLIKEIEINIKIAKQTFQKFKTFLEKLLEKNKGNFSLGEENFNFLLKNSFHLEETSEELLELGWELLNKTKKDLKMTANKISKSKTWKQIISENESGLLKPENLIDFYRKSTIKVKEYLIEKDLISLPSKDNLLVTKTPVFERVTMPFAAYIQPPAFSDQQEGYFWVNPIDQNCSKEDLEKKIKAHSKYVATTITVHEAYPGHHLQYAVTNRNKNIFRRFFNDTTFVEGWALYWEEEMFNQGFYGNDNFMHLIQLKDQLWRCCRVIIDIEIHRNKMSFSEAVNFLVETVSLDKNKAIGEVKRYTYTPTQPMSYIIGKHQIQKLKKKLKDKYPKKFTEKAFHDSFLSFGTIPIPLIEKEMLNSSLF